MNHPNWKTAPERATHYQHPRDNSGFYNAVYWRLDAHGIPAEAWSVHGENFFYHPSPTHTIDQFDERLIPRPTELALPAWDGQGLPPVGFECEIHGTVGQELRRQEFTWVPVLVIAHTDFGGAPIAVAKAIDGTATLGWGTAIKFRPIRTPEQIASEERKRAIKAMLDEAVGESPSSDSIGLCTLLYDAGYRKQTSL